MFCLAWPDDVKELFRKVDITNSDLEMVELLILWLVIDEVYPRLRAAYIALFSNNLPTVGRIKYRAMRGSLVVMQLVGALALPFKWLWRHC